MIQVSFPCGHARITIGDAAETVPICPVCGERRVRHVTAPPPRFRGLCQGPGARPEDLAAAPVASAAPSGPILWKEGPRG